MAKILAIDDDRQMQDRLLFELRKGGHQIRVTSDAEEGLRELDCREFDLVLLEIHFKCGSGFALLEQITRTRPDLPVIIHTGFSCYRDDFQSWIADSFVLKGTDFRELNQEIDRVLEKRAQGRPVGDFADLAQAWDRLSMAGK